MLDRRSRLIMGHLTIDNMLMTSRLEMPGNNSVTTFLIKEDQNKV